MTIAEVFKSCSQDYRDRAQSCDSTRASERFNYLAGYFERRASLQQEQIGEKPGEINPGAGPC